MTECGKTYRHAWHLFTTKRGKVKVCDGVYREDKTGNAANPAR